MLDSKETQKACPLNYTFFVCYLKVNPSSLYSLIVGDYNSDGELDIIYGDQYGVISAIDALTGSTSIGKIEGVVLYNDVISLSIGDYDNDGVNEISW